MPFSVNAVGSGDEREDADLIIPHKSHSSRECPSEKSLNVCVEPVSVRPVSSDPGAGGRWGLQLSRKLRNEPLVPLLAGSQNP